MIELAHHNPTDATQRSYRSTEEWSDMQVESELHNVSNAADNTRFVRFANQASWVVNWFLLGAKAYVFAVSSSKAVLAALVDSAVDLVSQAVLALADMYISKHSPDYPVGRSRLEALSVIACAFIMSMASVEVIQYAATDIYNGAMGNIPTIDITTNLYVILAVGIFLKAVLYVLCIAANKAASVPSDSLAALAEDHLNDVFSNSVAVATAAVAVHTPAWWVDPTGAMLISSIIIWRWVGIISEQVKKIVGHTAPPAFIEHIESIALQHDPRLEVDCTRVYHFGARYNVELEIVLPGRMTVEESHDLALALQHKIEGLLDVERAFVHVDHQRRDGLEHKVERELVLGSNSNGPPSPTKPPVVAGTAGLDGSINPVLINRGSSNGREQLV